MRDRHAPEQGLRPDCLSGSPPTRSAVTRNLSVRHGCCYAAARACAGAGMTTRVSRAMVVEPGRALAAGASVGADSAAGRSVFPRLAEEPSDSDSLTSTSTSESGTSSASQIAARSSLEASLRPRSTSDRYPRLTRALLETSRRVRLCETRVRRRLSPIASRNSSAISLLLNPSPVSPISTHEQDRLVPDLSLRTFPAHDRG